MKLRNLFGALVLALGLLVVPTPAHAAVFDPGVVSIYRDDFKNGGVIQTMSVNSDCLGSGPGTGFQWWLSLSGPLSVGNNISSVFAQVGGSPWRCNSMYVQAATPAGQWWGKCIKNTFYGGPYSNGIEHFGVPWNDNTQSIILRHENSCPVYG